MRAYPALVEEKGQNPDQFRARFEEEPAIPKLHPVRDDKFAALDDDLDDLDDLDDEEDEDDDKIFDDGEGEELYDEGEDKE